VAFGTLAVLETLLKVHYYNDSSKSLDLSEACLWACGHRWASAGHPDECSSEWCNGELVPVDESWPLENAINYLKKFGVASDADYPWPQDSSKGVACKCEKASPNTRIKASTQLKASTQIEASLSDGTIEIAKEYLLTNGPLIAEYDLEEEEGGGRHCVAVVGYNKEGWLLKDSLKKHDFLKYEDFYNRRGGMTLIVVHEPILEIWISSLTECKSLSLKIVRTNPPPGGKSSISGDPTLLYNLQKDYDAKYDTKLPGWLLINGYSTITLPLLLPVPPGDYKITADISDQEYSGSVKVVHVDGQDKVTPITLSPGSP
jgi:hypothetical protein